MEKAARDALALTRAIARHLGNGNEWAAEPFVFANGTSLARTAWLTHTRSRAKILVSLDAGTVQFAAGWPPDAAGRPELPDRFRTEPLAVRLPTTQSPEQIARELTRGFLATFEAEYARLQDDAHERMRLDAEAFAVAARLAKPFAWAVRPRDVHGARLVRDGIVIEGDAPEVSWICVFAGGPTTPARIRVALELDEAGAARLFALVQGGALRAPQACGASRPGVHREIES